ncbi:MAG: hypothetical protein MZV64_11675 [Ignavibacteriales bacterium]|nr:hypothetical protein [Ignavibacteriales bacterium]
MDAMIELSKTSPLANGRDEILVAGEKEFEYTKFNLRARRPAHQTHRGRPPRRRRKDRRAVRLQGGY